MSANDTNKMRIKHKITIAFGLITLATIGRLVPHLWNMTPLAGAKLGWRWGDYCADFGNDCQRYIYRFLFLAYFTVSLFFFRFCRFGWFFDSQNRKDRCDFRRQCFFRDGVFYHY